MRLAPRCTVYLPVCAAAVIVSIAGADLPPNPSLRLVEPRTFDGFGETAVTDLNDLGLAVGRMAYSYTDDNGNGHTTVGSFDWLYHVEDQPTITGMGLFTNNRGDRVTVGSAVAGAVFTPGDGGPPSVIPPVDGHTFVLAAEINNNGMVVGTSGIFQIGILSAIAWSEATGTINLSDFVPNARTADYASDNGWIVGHRPSTDGSPIEGFVLDINTGDWMDLYRYFNPTAPAGMGRTEVSAVNDAGQVVGRTTTDGGLLRAFVWSEADGHQFIPSPPFGGDPAYVYANHINNDGVVVGEALTGGGWRAYAWKPGTGFLPLQATANGSGYVLAYAVRVNDRGEVAGIAAPAHAPWSANRGYLVAAEACPADLAEPFGALNFFDLAAFLSLFQNGDPAADLAAPFGTLNFFDVSAYLAAYNAGCP